MVFSYWILGFFLDNKALKKADVSWLNEDQLKFILKEGKQKTNPAHVRISRVKSDWLKEGEDW